MHRSCRVISRLSSTSRRLQGDARQALLRATTPAIATSMRRCRRGGGSWEEMMSFDDDARRAGDAAVPARRQRAVRAMM